MNNFRQSFNIKNIDQPEWKDLVDRWYQLDQTSLALCQGIYNWSKVENRLSTTSAIIYFFDKGSELADRDFVHGIISGLGASPSKFVYTLPNIPMMIVQQMLKISVPVFNFDQSSKLNIKEITQALSLQFNDLMIISLKNPQIKDDEQLWTVQGYFLEKDNHLTTIENVEF
jgi:hypothetical protein